jgi:hypothetical protein
LRGRNVSHSFGVIFMLSYAESRVLACESASGDVMVAAVMGCE